MRNSRIIKVISKHIKVKHEILKNYKGFNQDMIDLLKIKRDNTCWKVLRDAKMEPPIQTLYFLSGGATTLIFMLLGANAVISLLILSAIPGNIVEPPLRTIFP